jgi:hypothetical protein
VQRTQQGYSINYVLTPGVHVMVSQVAWLTPPESIQLNNNHSRSLHNAPECKQASTSRAIPAPSLQLWLTIAI